MYQNIYPVALLAFIFASGQLDSAKIGDISKKKITNIDFAL